MQIPAQIRSSTLYIISDPDSDIRCNRLPIAMPFELVCDNCTFVLYRGNEIRSPKEVLRSYHERCKSCNSRLALENFGFEVTVANMHRPTIVGIGQSYLVV